MWKVFAKSDVHAFIVFVKYGFWSIAKERIIVQLTSREIPRRNVFFVDQEVIPRFTIFKLALLILVFFRRFVIIYLLSGLWTCFLIRQA